MRTPKGKRYVTNVDDADQYLCALKSVSCPHCSAVGFLIRHGFLRGYDERAVPTLRGWRVFCSNRYRRNGCGGTFSLSLGDVLHRLSISAHILWCFVLAICSGESIKTAWEDLEISSSLQTGYRLWRRLRLAQSRLRTFLCREKPPPLSRGSEPFFQLLEHLKSVFPFDSCPFAAFQIHFQQHLLD